MVAAWTLMAVVAALGLILAWWLVTAATAVVRELARKPDAH